MSQSRNEKRYILYQNYQIYIRKYLLNYDRLLVVCTSHFCVDYLERFVSCVSVKIVIGNFRVKCYRALVSNTFENINNLSLKGTDKQQMQLINKAMMFSVQVKILAILYAYYCLIMNKVN